MDRLLLLMIFCGIVFTTKGQYVQIDKDQCVHCQMSIRDHRFAAVAIDNAGHTLKFDAIECLINFLKGKQESIFEKILIADYSNSGNWVDASAATYLKSNLIPSPMGAFLSGFQLRSGAVKVQREKGGELYNWEEIKKTFKDSKFGLPDHSNHHHERPDAYAPIGIMGDHIHHQGSFMISARYMYMEMEGNLSGSSRIADMEIHQVYMASPQRMRMIMYMLGIMYAPSDRLTVMLMQQFIKKETDLSTRMESFTTESRGLGDTRLSALYSVFANEKTSFHINSGISIPQGNIITADDTPMAKDMKLPYPMQLGSGTVDLILGGTLKGTSKNIAWGAQQLSNFRTNRNSEGYHIGNEFNLNTWGSYKITSSVSVSARLEGTVLSGISGRDDDLNPMMAPAAHVKNSGYTRLRSYLGSNFAFNTNPTFKNFKIGIEYGLPCYQNVRGIQMDEGNTFNAGLRYLL